MERILVPVDFSEGSQRALQAAAEWAERYGAALHLLYVIEPPTVPQWGYAFLAVREAKLRKEAETQLNKLRELVSPEIPVTVEVLSGQGAEYEICKTAKERKAGLIIIGGHGSSPIRRAWLGSTAEQVVRHAPCPVLVLREKKR